MQVLHKVIINLKLFFLTILFLDLDPHYSVLLGDENKGDCSTASTTSTSTTPDHPIGVNSSTLYIIIPVVVGSVVLIGIAIFVTPRYYFILTYFFP